jgi:hypothetical protein
VELRPWRGDRAGSRTLIPAFSHGEKEECGGAGGFPSGGLEGALGGGGAALEPKAAGIRGGGGGAGGAGGAGGDEAGAYFPRGE